MTKVVTVGFGHMYSDRTPQTKGTTSSLCLNRLGGCYNTAESLLVALILKAASYLNETNQSTNNDIQVTI
ncbi:hypothetical protein AABK37_41075, partial [Hassallia sp. VBCCA 56010]